MWTSMRISMPIPVRIDVHSIWFRLKFNLTDIASTVRFSPGKVFLLPGISILYSKPPVEQPNLFSFLEPFAPEVWIYMAASFVGVSLFLFVLAR